MIKALFIVILILLIAVTCTCPPDPKNGYTTGCFRVANVGRRVYYECFGGYQLVGLKTRTCASTGSWLGDAPLCVDSKFLDVLMSTQFLTNEHLCLITYWKNECICAV